MLDLTPKTHVNRSGVLINPCKTCQPVGALFAALGVRNCALQPRITQGCSSYHRTYLTRHFKEPAIAVTSSFTEGACVFGGGPNIRQGVKTTFEVYDPDIIAVHTTCLSETIGDDLKTYIDDINSGRQDRGALQHADYVGSHVTGFANMMAGFISYLRQGQGHRNRGGVPRLCEPRRHP